MEWYKKLSINEKIQVKGELMDLLCGFGFEKLSFLFTFKERIDIMHIKLKMEGFDV